MSFSSQAPHGQPPVPAVRQDVRQRGLAEEAHRISPGPGPGRRGPAGAPAQNVAMHSLPDGLHAGSRSVLKRFWGSGFRGPLRFKIVLT